MPAREVPRRFSLALERRLPVPALRAAPPDSAATVVAFGPPIPEIEADDDLRHWREFFEHFDPDLVKGFDAVAAIGAADGSIRVYAIQRDEAPALVRTRSLRGVPIASLSLAIDLDSLEAAASNRPDKARAGFVLLACDDVGPPLFLEVLSNRKVEPTDASPPTLPDGLPDLWASGTRAAFGVLFFEDNSLRAVVRLKADNVDRLLALGKRSDTSATNQFRVINELGDVAAKDVIGLELVQSPHSQSPDALVVAVLGGLPVSGGSTTVSGT